MDDAQKELRTFLDRWRSIHEQGDQETVQQLMEAATHYAPPHPAMLSAISDAWTLATVAETSLRLQSGEPLGPELGRLWDDNVEQLYET